MRERDIIIHICWCHFVMRQVAAARRLAEPSLGYFLKNEEIKNDEIKNI